MKRSREPEEDDSSHHEQHVAIVPVPKIANLDPGDTDGQATTAIQCSLPGHTPGLSFTSYSDYEKHYNNAHTNRCLKCRRNFPSSHILDLHIQEHHDALTEVRRERGELIYACFVQACEDKFKSYGRRQDHLIKAHMYPNNYFFAVTKFGIDRRQSMLVEYRKAQGNQHKESRPQGQKPKKHAETSTASDDGGGDAGASKDVPMSEVEGPGEEKQETTTADAEMEDLTGALSSLKFVPRTVRLGPKKKAGFPSR